ncbi:MAG: trehalase-like domain-containing protein [Sodalis sp. (in: enterobacteria)]|uniref:trehalase-like domain-containing protein n=1 Tax=Sodalis sp. (in: enterobacteria) TaxID=1898979 RepID=UPI003F34A693
MMDLPKPGITRNIGDRGIIGDLRSCALVARDATIDYFCWPDLDSPSIFTALLDSEQAGLFSLPTGLVRRTATTVVPAGYQPTSCKPAGYRNRVWRR